MTAPSRQPGYRSRPEQRRRVRLAGLLQAHEHELRAPVERAKLAEALTVRDREVSRCGRCGDWRWRAAAHPCQGCGAAALVNLLDGCRACGHLVEPEPIAPVVELVGQLHQHLPGSTRATA